MESEFLTIQQLAAYLNMKPSTLYSLVPDLPHYRLGRLLRFKKNEIAEWLASKKESSERCTEKLSRRVAGPVHNINLIVRNAIDEAKSTSYNRPGISDRIKGLGKEG